MRRRLVHNRLEKRSVVDRVKAVAIEGIDAVNPSQVEQRPTYESRILRARQAETVAAGQKLLDQVCLRLVPIHGAVEAAAKSADVVDVDSQVSRDLALARAIAALDPIVSGDPNLYLAQYALGAALAGKAQYAEAVKHLHKAVELQPDSAWAHYEIGASLVKTGDFKSAIVHLEIATGRLPNFAPAHQALAEAYDHAGRADDAKRERGKR